MTTIQIILLMTWLFVFLSLAIREVTSTVVWIAMITAISFSVYALGH